MDLCTFNLLIIRPPKINILFPVTCSEKFGTEERRKILFYEKILCVESMESCQNSARKTFQKCYFFPKGIKFFFSTLKIRDGRVTGNQILFLPGLIIIKIRFSYGWLGPKGQLFAPIVHLNWSPTPPLKKS